MAFENALGKGENADECSSQLFTTQSRLLTTLRKEAF